MKNNNGYSEAFEMDKTKLRKYLRDWEKENLPSNRKNISVYDILKEMKVI